MHTQESELRIDIDVYEPESIVDGRYRVIRHIATGGNGVLYLVQHTWTRQIRVLKVSRQSVESAQQAMMREATALGSIRHRNVVSVYDAGRLDDGRVFLVMDHIDGATLTQVAQSRQLTVGEIIDVAAAVLRGLTALHDAGFVHRDVKPLNVMIPTMRQQFAFDRATLIDFGIARELKASNGNAQYTRLGCTSGTAQYMAPEQLAGQRQSVRTDVYAVGVLLFELLFGTPPLSEIPYSAAKCHIERGYVFGGPMVLRKLTTEVEIPAHGTDSGALRVLVARMLRRRPDERPATARDALTELLALDAPRFDGATPSVD